MKKYIHKINQHLLEHYPTIWNTKIVWMTLISLFIHLTFFVLGYFALTSPERLHSYGAKDIFFENGTVFFSIILSILLFVIWLVYLFKNNSFKNFYPTSKGNLFTQFLSYLFIVFIGSTFYITYTFGVKSYINTKYPDKEISEQIAITNDAATFFSHTISNYEINERRYPFPFENTYWEVDNHDVKRYEPYVTWLGKEYQLYSMKSKKLNDSQQYIDTIYDGYVYYTRKDSSKIYYFKDTVVDLRKYEDAIISNRKHADLPKLSPKKVFFKGKYVQMSPRVEYDNNNDLAVPSYLNFSTTFYNDKSDVSKFYNDSYTYDEYNYSRDGSLYSRLKVKRNKRVYELLKRNNPEEIKAILAQFLNIARIHKIEHNLDVQKWFDIIYNPNRFEVNSLIRTNPKVQLSYEEEIREETEIEKFIRTHETDYYIKTDNLRSVYNNIDDIKHSKLFLESLHFFIWFSFVLAMLIFIFRISGIKQLIFTIVAGGLIGMLIGMLTILVNYLKIFRGYKSEEYFALYLSIIIINLILFSTFFITNKLKKIVMSVFVNLSLASFVLNLFLIIVLISLHQRTACRDSYTVESCFEILDVLGAQNMSYILFFTGIVFVYFYAGIIKKWKGLPEE